MGGLRGAIRARDQVQVQVRPGTAAAAVRSLRRSFAGAVLVPGDDGYDGARRPLHPVFDPRPVAVAVATGAADVRSAIVTAREHDLPVAVQATGHGTIVPSDGGVLIKTSGLTGVFVDPDRRVARAGPGALWRDVIAAAAPFGLAPLSGSAPSVGVAGYTLGGGVGWLSRRYGFAADSLLRAEVVTADGRMRTASADRHADLFWALRGGGGNFGVVTSLEFRLYPVAQVYGGTAYFPISRAADVLGHFRDRADEAPDALSIAVLLRRMPVAPDVPEPVRGRRVVAIRGLYAGDAAAAERALRPLRDVAGPALLDGFRMMGYPETGTIGGTAPLHLDLFRRLPDDVLDTLIGAIEGPAGDPPVSTVEIRHWGGAMARPRRPDPGPAGHRDVPFSVIVDARVPSLAAALRPHATGGSFLNFLSDPARTETAYTARNYRRLAEIKRRYDPANVFHRGHNIPPRTTSDLLPPAQAS
ncbi:MAG TPA: FAD-binding oxidoreductase [Streptosporangiaceae bacterium]|nr:FAD-binding oxidoreductase [Streptosporangiaceae bacterium]